MMNIFIFIWNILYITNVKREFNIKRQTRMEISGNNMRWSWIWDTSRLITNFPPKSFRGFPFIS